jgi:hypothetical protein
VEYLEHVLESLDIFLFTIKFIVKMLGMNGMSLKEMDKMIGVMVEKEIMIGKEAMIGQMVIGQTEIGLIMAMMMDQVTIGQITVDKEVIADREVIAEKVVIMAKETIVEKVENLLYGSMIIQKHTNGYILLPLPYQQS